MSAPGWYPDPSGNGQRYFDGQKWTEHRAAAPPPAAAPKKRSNGPKINWSVLAVVLLFFGGCAVFSSMGDSDKPSGTTGTTEARATDAGAAKAGLGKEVRDGKFSFVVSDVSAPEHLTGSPEPRGQWMVATMAVTNIGNEPQSFFVQNQKLIDTAGREYAADTSAAYSMNEDNDSTMVFDLGPGFTIKIKVPFDVPPGTQAATIEVHDSAFSGGANVNVR